MTKCVWTYAFKKTANHFLNNLEPKFKKIRHKISVGETFDNILKNYSISKNEINVIKEKISKKININKLNTSQKIYFKVDQSNNKIVNFVFQVSNKERILLSRDNENNNFNEQIILTKLNKKIIYKVFINQLLIRKFLLIL